jgi:oligoribonuclease (3'-5' exoribonuclease)
MGKYIQALAWVDLESTGLPVPGDGIMDFRDLHLLEVAVLITDLDLEPIAGYHEVVRMTKGAADALRKNEVVRKMHTANHLIEDSARGATALTLDEIDTNIDALIQEKTSFEPGEFGIAGSGVARFDHPVIDIKMPKLARWLHYAEIDIGQFRRSTTIFNGGQTVVNPVPESSRDGVKTHRAWDDVQAHLKEAKRYRDFVRAAATALGRGA